VVDMSEHVVEAIVGSLENFKKALWRLRKKGIEFDSLVVNPNSIESLLRYVVEWGADPFPAKRFSWRHPFRKRDPRPYFCGVPIQLSDTIPRGAIGTVADFDEDEVPEVVRQFKKMSERNKRDDAVSPGGQVAPEGVGAEMAKSTEDPKTLTDMMIKAMEGMEKAHHIIILRFFDGSMDTFSNYSTLEMQAVLQQALIRVMQGGGE